jgi:hypothetical protein
MTLRVMQIALLFFFALQLEIYTTDEVIESIRTSRKTNEQKKSLTLL